MFCLLKAFNGPSVVYFILTIRVWLFLNWYRIRKNLTVCTMYCASSFQSSKEGSISWVSQLHTACRTECPTEKNKCGKSKITIYVVISFYLSQYLLDVEVSQIHVHFLQTGFVTIRFHKPQLLPHFGHILIQVQEV